MAPKNFGSILFGAKKCDDKKCGTKKSDAKNNWRQKERRQTSMDPFIQEFLFDINVRYFPGPPGVKGDEGNVGMKGERGISCNRSEINQLYNRISQLESQLTSKYLYCLLANSPRAINR